MTSICELPVAETEGRRKCDGRGGDWTAEGREEMVGTNSDSGTIFTDGGSMSSVGLT